MGTTEVPAPARPRHFALCIALAACMMTGVPCARGDNPERADSPDESQWAVQRERLVRESIQARGIRDSLVLAAMRHVPRHRFVPRPYRARSYLNRPLPIGEDQTISQPYIVALMTELLELSPGDRVLEVGTGSGYQAAVLLEITDHVYSIEIRPSLAESARKRLDDLRYPNVTIRTGDGYKGWPSEAPFDVIIVTAAPPQIPGALVEQLAPGGRLVLPVGDTRKYQILTLIRKDENGVVTREDGERVRFVPMIHETD